MKKILFILCALLAGVSGAWAEDVTYYTPKNRVTTFSSEKMYMIYNTCIDGDQDRTGFIYVDGSGSMKKYTGSTDRNPKQFRTRNNAYLWKVVTGADNHVSIQNVSNSKYYGYNLSSNASDPENLYLYQWEESVPGKSGANSQNEDDPSTKTANKDITFATNKVFVIGNKDAEGDNTQFWNGNVGDIVNWGNGHPFAFYEVEEVTVPVTVLSGYNTYVDTKTIGTTEWKTQSNWVLASGENSWNTGPGYTGSNMWYPIYLKDVTATGIEFEGWNLRLKLVNSSLTANIVKLQTGTSSTIDVDETSILNLTLSSNNNNGWTRIFNVDGNLTINMGAYNWSTGTSSNTINLGTTGQFTITANSAKTIPAASSFTINATLTDPTEKNTIESRTLATFTQVTVSTLTPTISAPDGWTSVANKAELDEQTADGKYYWVEQNSSGVTLKTYQFQVASKKQQAKDKVSPYYDGSYVGAGLGKYTISLGETAYSTYSAFETAVNGWTTIGDCVEPTIAINQPTAGFYRFKAAARSANDNTYNWYMGGNTEGIYSASTTDPQASDANTIFYVEKDGAGYHPINYVSGLYSNGTANNAVGTKSNFTLTQAIKENNTDVLYGEYKLFNTGANKVIVMWNNSYLNAINGNNDWSGWTIEPVESLPVTFKGQFASFYSPVDLTLPSGVKAYTGTLNGKTKLELSEVDKVPANTGVILEYAAFISETTIDFPILSTVTPVEGTALLGSPAAQSVDAESKLVLGKDGEGNWGIYTYGTGVGKVTLGGFKAYMDDPGEVKGFTFSFGDLNEVVSILNGEKGDGEVYDLSGRQTKKPTRGFYITKGQKAYIK